MHDAEVAVIGVGGIGSMALWRLARAGATVHGYEQFGVGHDRGASSGQNRRFSVHSQSDPVFTALALQARTLWGELEDQTGARVLETIGGLIIAPPDDPRFVNAEQSALLYDLSYERLSTDGARSRYPQHAFDDGDEVLVDPFAGFVRPERAVLTAAAAARDLGAVIHDRTSVLSVEPDADGVVVRTAETSRRYRRAVIATGAWARRLLPRLEPFVLPRRLVQTWYAPTDPESFTPDRFPVFERLGRVVGYGFPSLDGATVKIVVRLGDHPVVQDLDAPPRTISPGLLDRYARIIPTILPTLNPYPVGTALGFEGYVPDARAILGPLEPGSPLVAAVGFSGSGFKFAPAMGEAAARYALGEPSIPEVAMLSPQRPMPRWDAAMRSRT